MKKKCSRFLENFRKDLLDFIDLCMKVTLTRRITVTSSLNKISTEGGGGGREALLRPPQPLSTARQIFKDDVYGLSSTKRGRILETWLYVSCFKITYGLMAT